MSSSSQPNSSASASPLNRARTDKTEKKESSVTHDDFPVDKENPFDTSFCDSDVVLIVEGRKLHTHKSLLSVYSSYFRVMFGSQHFAEAGAREIELKGNEFVEVKYDAMVKFLLQFYPVHSFKEITDEKKLMDLFPLAEYFQCRHVIAKCYAYIQQTVKDRTIPVQSALLYLRVCASYKAQQFIEVLLTSVSHSKLKDIQSSEHFKWLTPEVQSNVYQKRADYLEKKELKQQNAAKNLFALTTRGPKSCTNCQTKTTSDDVSVLCCECVDMFKQVLSQQ